jgi:Xaa-Pro aminopeptidase
MSAKADVISSSELLLRIQNLRKKLNDADLDGALLLSSQECYYYSGIGIEGGVFVPVEGEPVHLIKRNLAFGRAHSAIAQVQESGRQSKLFETLGIKPHTKLAIEADLLPFSFVNYLQSKANGTELVDGSQLFRQLRAVKSDSEINLIEQAARTVDRMFIFCQEIARPEMTEIELSSRLDSWLLQNGHDGFITTHAFNSLMFQYSYVVSSAAAAMNTYFTPVSSTGLSLKYPYGSSRTKIGRGHPFLVDACGNHQGYISDTTRTFVCGRFDKVSRDQLDALDQMTAFIGHELRPGSNLGELYGRVLELARGLGIEECFMGLGPDKVPFLGHGVGLELDDLPVFHAGGPELLAGNVLACEPKIIIPGKRVLGIEDTYAITQSGCRRLSNARESFEV